MKKLLMILLSLGLILRMTACSTSTQEPTDDVKALYTAGTYTGVSAGRGGDVTVEVTLSDNAIESVTVVSHSETKGVSDLPLAQIPAEIVEYQSLGVDMISGATMTSGAILRAVKSAIEQAGGDVKALSEVAVNKEKPAAEDLTTQIVIAGGGMAGLSAAAFAAEQGADVIVVEKLPYTGGSLMVAGGYYAAVNSTHFETSQNLDIVMDQVRSINSDSVRQPDYDFLEYMLGETGKTMDYFIDEFGWEPQFFGDGSGYGKMWFSANGFSNVEGLNKVLEEHGVKVLLNTTAESIVMTDGKATGLVVSNESGEFTITADKVMIATGGANYDLELLKEKNPEIKTTGLSEQASVGNTFDGVKMLAEIGADVSDGPFVKSATPDFSMALGFTWATNPGKDNNLMVDVDGNRFANESPFAGPCLNTYMLTHGSEAYYIIYDTVNIKEDLKANFDAHEGNKNVVVYAETIEELAEKLEMNPETLRATFDRYQEHCADGVDEDFGKAASHLIAYAEEGGYYAAKITPASWGTIGGVEIDRNFHVLNTNGKVIENLFAIGETATADFFGDYYLGGFSLGIYSTAGRIAADTAVAELSK